MTETQRRARPIAWICGGFALLGGTLPFAYHLAIFAPYRDAVGAAVGDVALATRSPTLLLCLGMTGGSILGKWLAHLGVARLGLHAGRAGAVQATTLGLVSWLVLDTAVSISSGAWANAVLINPMPVLLLGPALASYARGTHVEPGAPIPLRVALRVAHGAALLGAASGVAIALLGDSARFGPWRAALAAAHFDGGPLPEAPRQLVRFFLGPIGGSTFGHFLLVAYLVRRAPDLGERPALRWSLGSVLGWFLVDSTASLVAGAAFNVVLVNLPALVLTGGPLAFALATAPAEVTDARASRD